VAVTRNTCACFIADLLTASVTRSCQRGVKLAADQFLDELSRPSANFVSIGSNQLSKKWVAASSAGCTESGFVVWLFMAWSPVRRFNAG
jgi:hypothetical protein